MSTLTKNERDGLEEVFLSIHSNERKFDKFKELSKIVMNKSTDISMTKLLKRAKHGLYNTKFSQFFSILALKKKNIQYV